MANPQPRSQAIDVMRGLTLALMIVVNMSISETLSYAPLLHAAWHGLTLTDVVFPTFLFAVGCSMSFSLGKYPNDGALLGKVFKRTALIFLCGYLLYWFPFFQFDPAGQLTLLPLAKTRILGVLQRIALCYCLAALILHYWRERGALIFCGLALLGYWWLMTALGDFTLAGNAALKLDLWLFGEAHLYHGEGMAFDPEGLLGTLPATVNLLAGYFAGRFIQAKGPGYESIAKLLLTGALCLLVALCWSSVFPINKKLWTSSYTLCTAGIDLFLLAALVYGVDLLRLRRWAWPFEIFGKNTLFIYLLAEVAMTILWTVKVGQQAAFEWIYQGAFQGWAGDKPGSLIFALLFTLTCWLIAFAMDRKKIYIKL